MIIKKNITIFVLALAIIFGLFSFSTVSADSYCASSSTMTYDEVLNAQADGMVSYSISINGSTAKSSIVNKTDCYFTVELASWNMYDRVLENQTLYSSSGVQSIAPKSNKTITTTLPSCMAQVDLYYDSAPNSPEQAEELAWDYSRMTGGSSYSDASGPFCSNAVTVPLTGSCYASPSNPKVGEEVKWTADATGGAGGHTYSWTGSENLYSSGNHYAFKTYNNSGTKNVTVTISDIAYGGTQTITTNCSVYVSANQTTPDPDSAYATCGSAANKPTATAPKDNFCKLGHLVEGPATTGDGTNRWWWGCDLTPSAPAVTYCFAPKTQIDDNDDLNVSCEADDSNVDVDEDVYWSATVSGGNGNYSYDWDGTDGLNSSRQNVTWSYDDDGTKTATVTVTSGGKTASDSCTVRVEEDEDDNDDDLEVSCYANPSDPDVGEQMNWYVRVSGGDGDYDYDWTGTNGLNSSSRSPSKTYTTTGRKTATVTVEDGDGNEESDTCSVTVNQNSVLAFSEYNQTPYQEAIYLSQVPYTGAAEDWSFALFLAGLSLFSAYVAYVVIAYKKNNGELN